MKRMAIMTNIYLYIIPLALAIIIMYLWNRRKRLMAIKQNIINSWGKPRKHDYSEEEMASIRSYFRNRKNSENFFIDDITWDDLNMDEVFRRINNTQSSVGEEFLYNTLRQPLFDEEDMKKRDKIIEYFQNNEKERVEIQYIIARLGRSKIAQVSDYFQKELRCSNKLAYYRILSYLPVIFIILYIIIQVSILPLLAIVSIVINSYIHFILFRKNEFEIQRLNYIVALVQCAEKIAEFKIEEIKEDILAVKVSLIKLKKLKSISSAFDPNVVSDFAIVMDYVKMFFLVDVKKFEKINRTLENNKKDLKLIYEFVGSADTFISVASYRKSLDYYTKPIFGSYSSRKYIDFKDIYHPLIKKPVANSCEIYKSILLTGSNASGKSTFLKTMAINSILSQTIYTCLASEYKSCYFKTYTSMALRDDIISNDSYYIVEIKSLKRIIENVNSSVPCLCFIDEILRGTNTVERISASSEVLNYISNCNCLCISATHDVELTSILDGVYENYHFQENIDNDQITFDYKLYKGKSETRNAIKLLNIMGYDNDIVSRAEGRANDFIENGVWKVI